MSLVFFQKSVIKSVITYCSFYCWQKKIAKKIGSLIFTNFDPSYGTFYLLQLQVDNIFFFTFALTMKVRIATKVSNNFLKSSPKFYFIWNFKSAQSYK